jgi:FemAB-related protein (PEP-CTERM system-associated)
MAVEIRALNFEEHGAWDDFVLRHPCGSTFHLTAWKKAIEAVFKYKPFYLVAADSGVIQAVLPLFLIDNFLMGRVLISSPFAVYGGVLSVSDEASGALRESIIRLSKDLDVQYIELRNGYSQQCLGFSPVNRYVTFTQPVEPQDGEQLLAALPKKTRNMVRKACKNAYSVRSTRQLKSFEDLISRSYQRLGTPCFPPLWFSTLCKTFGDRVDVREVMLNDVVVAVSMNFFFRDQMHTFYAASDPGYLNYAPNNYLYFDHLLWAGNSGYRVFDFGRSKLDTGTFEFKKHWTTEMRELPYEILLAARKDLPNFTPKNEKFSLAIRAWQKLPLPVTRLLGPRIIRLFP